LQFAACFVLAALTEIFGFVFVRLFFIKRRKEEKIVLPGGALLACWLWLWLLVVSCSGVEGPQKKEEKREKRNTHGA
jgi:drug/metabolite transporter superfamily protein YnfA